MPPGRVRDTIYYSVELHNRILQVVKLENERRARSGEELLEKRSDQLVWLIQEGLRSALNRMQTLGMR